METNGGLDPSHVVFEKTHCLCSPEKRVSAFNDAEGVLHLDHTTVSRLPWRQQTLLHLAHGCAR